MTWGGYYNSLWYTCSRTNNEVIHQDDKQPDGLSADFRAARIGGGMQTRQQLTVWISRHAICLLL